MSHTNNAELFYHLMPAGSFSPLRVGPLPTVPRGRGRGPPGRAVPPTPQLSPVPQAEPRTEHVEQRVLPPPSPPGSGLKLAHPLLADARHKDKLAVLDLLFKASIK